MRQNADGRYEHPGYENDDRSQNRIEGGCAGAVFRRIHRHENDDAERRHEAEAGHERGDDAADGQGKAQRKQAEEEYGNTGNVEILAVGHIRVDEAFVNVMGIQRRRAEQEIAGAADVGCPKSRQGNAGQPRVEGHDDLGQCSRSRNVGI